MKLKYDAEGHVVVEDGKPVYSHDDGKDIAFDAPSAVSTIARINAEAKGHREKAKEHKDALKAFDGIEDPTEALKALTIVKNLDAKKLVDAGEIDKVRDEAIKAFEGKIKSVEEKYAPVVQERDALKNALVQEKVGGSFARSKLIAERLAIPADMVQSRFGNSFKVDGDAVVAYDQNGNKIYSRAKPGEVAAFDEALEILIDQYPYRDHIMKGSGANGGGAQGGGGNGGKRTVTRAQFEALDPATQATTARAAGKGEVVIVD